MEKRPFFRAAMAGLGKYCMGGYGWIGVYRVKPVYQTPFQCSFLNLIIEVKPVHALAIMMYHVCRPAN